jgi:hypothetical protein
MALDFEPAHVFPELRIPIFGFMTLINDNDVISHVRQVLRLGGDHAVRSYKYSSLLSQLPHLAVPIVLLDVVKLHDWGARAPLAKLFSPVSFHGRWDHDKYFRNELVVKKAFEISGHLDSLAQAHVVTEHSTLLIAPEVVEPLHTEFLVIKQV